MEKENFFLLPQSFSFRQSLSYILNSLIEENVADERFKEAMLEREARVTMLFDENIGFPHVLYQGNRLIFSLGVVKRKKEEKRQ